MDDGWVEVPAVHEPIVRTRFEKKSLLQLRWTKRVRVELQRPNISRTPLASSFSLAIGFHKIRGPA
jgi:hypothetical protein